MQFSQITLNDNKKTSAFLIILYVFPLVLGLVLLYGQIFLVADGPIHATDNEVPIDPLYYFWNIIHPWNPLSLGSSSSPNLLDVLFGSIAAISFGDYFISQIIVLTLPPILSYFGMVLLLRKFLKNTHVGCIAGAFFVAFSPAYLAWFSLPYMIGVSLLPWLFYIGLNGIESIISGKTDFKKILFYTASFSLVLSAISSAYSHVLPLIISFLVLSISGLLWKNRTRINRKRTGLIIISVFIIIIFFAVGFSRVFELYSLVSSDNTGLIGTHDIESVKSLWERATINNIIRLAGGSPNIEQFRLAEAQQFSFLIPYFVFIGLIFLVEKPVRSFFSNKLHIHLVFFGIIGLLIGISVFYRNVVFAEDPIITNLLLSGLRRPERIMELLSFFYGIGIAFSFSVIELRTISFFEFLKSKIRKGGNTTIRKSSLVVITITIIIGFILIHSILFSYLHINPENPVRSNHFSKVPSEFIFLNNFLSTDESSNHKSDYRYNILPMYQPLTGYLRYNYPNFLYASGFAPNHVTNFVSVTNGLMAEQNPNVIQLLNLASIKKIGVIPESFMNEELQNWRLKGITRLNGINLFGDVKNYNNFVDSLPLIKNNDNGMNTFENTGAIPRVFVPEVLVKTDQELKSGIDDLGFLSKVRELQGYVLVNNDKQLSKNNFMIEDHINHERISAEITRIKDAKVDFSATNIEKEFKSSDIIIWSDQRTVGEGKDKIILNGNVPQDKEGLSIWLKLPHIDQSSELTSIKFGLTLNDKTKTKDSFRILLSDSNNNYLPIDVEKTQINDSGHFLVNVTPFEGNPVVMTLMLIGEPNSFQSVTVDKNFQLSYIESLNVILPTDPSVIKTVKFVPIKIKENNIVVPNQLANGTIVFSIIKESQEIDTKLAIVWSDDGRISKLMDKLVVSGTVPPQRVFEDGLSTWIRVPETNIDNDYFIQFELHSMYDITNFRFDVFNEKNEEVYSNVELDEIAIGTYRISINPEEKPYMLRIIIKGHSGEEKTYSISKSLIFEREFIVPKSYQVFSQIHFPTLIVNNKHVVLPNKYQQDSFVFSVSGPISFKESAIINLSQEQYENRWNKVTEEISWLSPTEIEVKVDLNTFGNSNRSLTIPVYFGNSYNNSWKIQGFPSSGEVSDIKHVMANGFANLWLITIEDYENNPTLSMKIYWDKTDLLMHQIHGTVGMVLVIMPFYLLFDNSISKVKKRFSKINIENS